MRIRILTVGNKMPDWVGKAYQDYVKRFSHPWAIELIELSAQKRTKQTAIHTLMEREGEKILSAISQDHHVITLEVTGKPWSTETLASHLDTQKGKTRTIDFVIGGADGLSTNCLARANARWSLSNLTLPHPIVRIIVIEQLYRAVSILNNHPYHRA